MFVSHFFDPDLRVEIFFEKEGAAENRGVDFEIEDIGNSVHLYRRMKKLSCKTYLLCFFIVSFVTKNSF